MFESPPPSTMTSGSSKLHTAGKAARKAVCVAGEGGPAGFVSLGCARDNLLAAQTCLLKR